MGLATSSGPARTHAAPSGAWGGVVGTTTINMALLAELKDPCNVQGRARLSVRTGLGAPASERRARGDALCRAQGMPKDE
jgi:hypothetical protein